MSRFIRTLVVISASAAALTFATTGRAAPITYTLFVHGGNGSIGKYDSTTPSGTRGSNLVASGIAGEALTVGPDGKIYVANGTAVDRYTAAGVLDQSGYVTGLPSGALGLKFGSDGSLYIGDNTNGVKKATGISGGFTSYLNINTTSIEGPQLKQAARITFGPDGKMYIPDGLQPGGGADRVFSYDGTTLHSVYTTSGITTDPNSVDFGPDGNMYVSEYGSSKVEKVVAGVGSTFISLSRAYGLRFTPDGRLYVSSYDSNNVNAYDSTSGALLSSVGVSGNVMNAANGGITGPAQLDFLDTTPVPEPMACATLALAGFGMLGRRFRRHAGVIN